MNKKGFIFIVIILLMFAGVNIYIREFKNYNEPNSNNKNYNDKDREEIISQNKVISDELSQMIADSNSQTNEKTSSGSYDDSEISKTDEVREKLLKIKKNFSIKGVLREGDDYRESNLPLLALTKYIQAHNTYPEDEDTIIKIGDVYMELKRFDKALEYYTKIKDYSPEIGQKIIWSLLYSKDMKKKDELREVATTIKDMNVNKEIKFYYINTLNCTIDIHKCKKNYQEYIANNELETEKMISIKNSIDTYNNFQVDELYYKDTLITGAFFSGKDYPISIITGENILKEKKNYKPLLLIIGKSYYELGDYLRAKNYLMKYYELDPSDTKVSYILGDINYYLKDYIGSNLYYSNAIENGYKPKVFLMRKLVFNYYKLDDEESMIKKFEELVEEEDASVDDFSLLIYHYIMNSQIDKALSLGEKSLEKFPDRELFYGYMGWIYREIGDIEKAEEYLKEGYKMNPKNPLISLNMAYLLVKKDSLRLALVYFRKTVDLNENGEFGDLAKKEIKILEDYFEKKEKEKEIVEKNKDDSVSATNSSSES